MEVVFLVPFRGSGLRVSDIIQLNYGDLKDALALDSGGVLITMKTTKTGTTAKPIFSIESMEFIRKWIDRRILLGETMTDSSPLFTKIEGKGKYTERMKSDTVSNVILRLARKAGLKGVSAHSLRKFHQTFLQAGGMPETWICKLQGRQIRDSREAYVKPTDKMLIDKYKRAYPKLSVYERMPIEEVETLKEQVKKLTAQMNHIMKTWIPARDKMRTDFEAQGADIPEFLKDKRE